MNSSGHLRMSWAIGAVLLFVLWLSPVLLGLDDGRILAMPVLGLVSVLGLGRLIDPEARLRFVQLWGLGMGIRWLALSLFGVVQRQIGSVVLGPDGTSYLVGSTALAANGLWPDSPLSQLGTRDVGPYFVFATVIASFGNSLLVLQAMNATFGALVAPLTYSWVRLVLPRTATMVGVVLALYPSAVVLATLDLLKDPAVLLATTVAVWAIANLLHSEATVRRSVVFFVLLVSALVFLRASRFYMPMLLASGVCAVVVVGLVRRQMMCPRNAGVVVSAFLVAELVLVPFGWPLSAQTAWQVGRGAVRVAATQPAPGPPVEESVAERRNDDGSVSVSSLGESVRFAQSSPPVVVESPAAVADGNATEGDVARALRPETGEYRVLEVPTALSGYITAVARKAVGPFIWVLPEDLSLRTILSGDYLLYPGTLIWYVLWPCMLVGLCVVMRRFWQGETPAVIAITAVFAAASLVMYFAVTLSYRQRDALFPFLLILGVIGVDVMRHRRLWIWLYGLYWVGLLGLATVHLTMLSSHRT